MMHKKINFLNVFSILLFVIVLAIGVFFSFNSYIKKDNQFATWFDAIATLVGIIFVYLQIYEQQKEHQANLKIYITQTKSTYLEKDSSGLGLDIAGESINIVPVNVGLVPGTYRLLGICKKKDWDLFLKKELLKVQRNLKVNVGLFKTKLFYRDKDILPDQGSIPESKPISDLTGNELIYPTSSKSFEIIEPKGIGKIKNFPIYSSSSNEKTNIKEKLNIKPYEPTKLVVIYLDPNYTPYTAETTLLLDNEMYLATEEDK